MELSWNDSNPFMDDGDFNHTDASNFSHLDDDDDAAAPQEGAATERHALLPGKHNQEQLNKNKGSGGRENLETSRTWLFDDGGVLKARQHRIRWTHRCYGAGGLLLLALLVYSAFVFVEWRRSDDDDDSGGGSSSIDDLFTASNEYTARDGAYATQ